MGLMGSPISSLPKEEIGWGGGTFALAGRWEEATRPQKKVDPQNKLLLERERA